MNETIWNQRMTMKDRTLYRYLLVNQQNSSAKFGACEVCAGPVAEVFYQSEERYFTIESLGHAGWTQADCNSYFGHSECLETKRRGVAVDPAILHSDFNLLVIEEGDDRGTLVTADDLYYSKRMVGSLGEDQIEAAINSLTIGATFRDPGNLDYRPWAVRRVR